jgi:hypothetical protein
MHNLPCIVICIHRLLNATLSSAQTVSCSGCGGGNMFSDIIHGLMTAYQSLI